MNCPTVFIQVADDEAVNNVENLMELYRQMNVDRIVFKQRILNRLHLNIFRQ